MAQKARQVGASDQSSQKVKTDSWYAKSGRNEIVEIKTLIQGSKKTKFKKAISLLESGDWIINSN